MKLTPASPTFRITFRTTFGTSVAPTACPAGAAFAMLDSVEQQLLEAALFDGQRCADLAGVLGVPAIEVRQRLGRAMLELRAVLADRESCGSEPMAVMLALHALDALDSDEAALVDAMLAHQPALRRTHAGYCELVGELCLMVPHAEPPPLDRSWLRDAFDDDAAMN
jgi:hypothetical protein